MSTPTIHLDLLSQVRIASPCTARWDEMTGDERTRLCSQCNLCVHNLSAMTHSEAEALVAGAGQASGVCVRLYRRADGTVITQDCPVGFARARAAARKMAARIAAALAFALAGGAAAATTSKSPWAGALRLRALQPFAAITTWLTPSAPPLGPITRNPGSYIMGKVSMPYIPPPPGPPPPPPPPPSAPANNGD